ncbi:FHA domain-containing protein [uncultured Parabacteroides sp.]|uniref:FHA domain-containing protein n=1 Tax=uncultured Parabacteroides sp. TaxID=512312 RepID=UPI00280534D3|nr:FHA domain-containing protein [uncultured Parabacteroides sp.]MBD9167580.1 FHA domain-containing protein [Parabacteroides johnsonii]
MVQRQTEPYRRSFSGSVGAGMGALMGGAHKQYYVLEHRMSSKYHRAGETQKIIVDQVEMGRDPRCQVRFDDSFTSVSRRHAAIVRDGAGWKLVHLSKVNTTLLNGRPVTDEWYLQNGDEIQLSSNGPRMGFIVPQGDRSMIKNINFTERFSLFRQQALKPYKQMMVWMSVVFLLVIGGFIAWNILNQQQAQKTNEMLAGSIASVSARQDSAGVEAQKQLAAVSTQAQNAAQAAIQASQASQTSTSQGISQLRNELVGLKSDLKTVREEKAENESARQAAAVSEPVAAPASASVAPAAGGMTSYESCFPYIYYIQLDKVEHTNKKGKTEVINIIRRWAGTGFLLSDGRFVTSRRIIERWYFQVNGNLMDEDMRPLNKAVCNLEKVVAYFTAYSSSGDALTFTSDQFTCDRSADNYTVLRGPLGGLVKGARLRIAPSNGGKDWAYFQTAKKGGLKFDPSKSTSLGRGIPLTILGFPAEVGINSASGPVYGSGVTANSGLDRGDIMTTNTSFEVGGSGAPVFAVSETGEYEVVGLISSMAEGQRGVVVPISAVR